MKLRLTLGLAIIPMTLLIVSCGSLAISINDTNPPVFSFSAGRFAECCDHLTFLAVWEIPNSEQDLSLSEAKEKKIIWEIWPMSGTDNSANRLPTIIYGEVPSGFVQKIPTVGAPPQLEEGKIYEVSGPRVEVPKAFVRFRIQKGKAVQVSMR